MPSICIRLPSAAVCFLSVEQIPQVQRKAQSDDGGECEDSQRIGQLPWRIPSGDLVHQELYVGIMVRRISQKRPDLPVPVGTEAVSKAIPNTQEQPGKQGEADGEQMNATGIAPNPSDHVEEQKDPMKPEKEMIHEYQSLMIQRIEQYSDLSVKPV
nr:hypothetical protein [Salinispira pacifica]